MTEIGRYEIEHELGSGAMGVVYLARDPRLERQVAIKVIRLPQGLSEDTRAEFRERFLREARAAAGLAHRSIVTVYEFDDDPDCGAPFLAMEYVPGRSLRQLLDDEGRLEPSRAGELARRVADALQAAHQAGIVHRDLKPANLLVREADGEVKIVDFGIARLPGSDLTGTGATLGSPAYMSPEQVRGRPVDGRSDLFSLAVILYEVLTGERPFQGDEIPAIAFAVVHETPLPVSRRVPGLPRSLDRFFVRALAKEPENRFDSAAEFAQALEIALADDPRVDADATALQRATSPAPRPTRADPVADSSVALATESAASPAPLVTGTDSVAAGPINPYDERPFGGWKRWVVAATAGLLLLVVSAAMIRGNREVYLRLEGRSNVEQGNLLLTLDDREVFTRELARPVRRAGRFKRLIESNHETFEAWIETSPGKHEITATIATDGIEAYRDTIVVDLEPGEQRTLKLVAGRKFGVGAPLVLRLD